MDKLLIFDGHALMHRAFHAIPHLTTPKSEPINAVYGTVSMLLNVVQNLEPTHICFVFDEKAPTFRNKLSEQYQSQRPEMAKELDSQFEKVKIFLERAGIPWYSKPGYEADDVIGTIANKFGHSIVVTGDRDILQIVDDKNDIKLFMPLLGLSNGRVYDEKETETRMGVPPKQIPDLKALTGDPSDNYKGVAGIGPKTAITLLKEFDTIENIYAHLNDISPKVRQKLEVGKEDAKLSLELATIKTDVPVNFDLPQMGKWKLDSPEVIKLFTEDFGFKTLTARIKKFGEDLEVKRQGSLF